MAEHKANSNNVYSKDFVLFVVCLCLVVPVTLILRVCAGNENPITGLERQMDGGVTVLKAFRSEQLVLLWTRKIIHTSYQVVVKNICLIQSKGIVANVCLLF